MTQALILGLDGATFSILDAMIKRGCMPFLGTLKSRGAHGVLRSTIPPLTPPAWISLVTGRTPGNHGITNFMQFAGPQSSDVRLVSARQQSCELLWTMVNRHGLRAGSLNFIAHHPAPPVNGYVIPGWVPWRWIRKYSHPADLIDRLKNSLPGFDIKKLAMDFKEETKAIAGAHIEDHAQWIQMHIQRERQWFDVLRCQMAHDPCALVGIVFDGVDKLQHLLWLYIDPEMEPADPSPEFLMIREHCCSYFRALDDIVQQAVHMAGHKSLVLIVSDHGFAKTEDVVYINTWLAERGYLAWKAATECVPRVSNELGEPELYHLTALDLDRTRAFAYSASSNGIHIRVKGARGDEGIEPENYLPFRAKLADELLSRCCDPETGEPLVARVWTREEIFSGPHMDIAPDLTLELRAGGFFSVLRSHTVHKKRTIAMGTHHADGVFMAIGPDVQAGICLEEVRLIDVAPTVLFALGLPVPQDLEGRVIENIFTPEYLAGVRPETAPPTAAVHAAGEHPPEVDPLVLKVLRDLGYVE